MLRAREYLARFLFSKEPLARLFLMWFYVSRLVI